MMPFMDIFRLMIGLLATMSLGGMGLMLFMMKVPSTEILNIHFLGEFMMALALVMFILTYWTPVYYSGVKNG